MYKNRSLISDWDTLRLILAIDRQGGVSGAARFLGVTHATVSRRLAKAEQDAGQTFFERLPAGLRLTEIGRTVLHHAQRVEPEFDSLERTLMSREQDMSGALRVTIPPLMMTDAVSTDIAGFAMKYPDIQLEFVGDNNLLNLHQREADVAIRVTAKPPETLWGRKLTDQSSGYFAADGWLAKSAIDTGDVTADLPLISFTSWINPIPKKLQQLCPNVRIVATSDDMVTTMQMVRAGLGISRMPKVLGEAMPGVRRIKALDWDPYVPLWLLTHADLRKTPRVEAFMQFMGDRISKRRQQYCITQ
ncbi:MAG: LysR family transcriptional regulator [Rhizobiaceae bacterium]|nr:LysR family transcriptional regulator [Hyphomicrobiales bacterium]NRB30214.1 LysR family transcriptional regulator [Rhizobiaceae bacterium]